MLPLVGVIEFGNHPGLFSLLNALYFLVLPLFAALNGFVLLLAVRRRMLTMSLALPVLAAFYGLVSLFHQIPVYLYFTSVLSIAGSLWLLAALKPRWKLPMSAMLVVLSGVSLAFHAGEPIPHTIIDYIRPTKTELFNSHSQLPNVDLWINENSLAAYKKVVHIIEEETSRGDYLFAIPNNAELYFMTDRPNPFRFFSTDHGVMSGTEVQNIVQTLERLRPRIITFSPGDGRNNTHSLAIMEHVREHSLLLSKDPLFEVYLYGAQNGTTKNKDKGEVEVAKN